MTETVCIALLRGINVGGKNKLPMKDLVQIFTKAGCADVTTYIQSGNVVFHADAGREKDLRARLQDSIAKRFGIDVPVVLRTGAELSRVVEGNPFQQRGIDAEKLHVAFLADLPAAVTLDSKRSPGDAFELVGRELFLHLPNGVARTKLTNQYFDSRLKTVSTIRNWNTVLKLRDLAESL